MIDVSSKKRQKELGDFGDRLPDALSNQLPMASAPFSFIHNKQKVDLAAADQYAIAQRDEQQSLSHLDEWQIAAGTTTTGHLVRSAFAKLLEDGEEDLEFKSSWGTDAYNTVLRDYDLRGSDHVMKRLSTADNAEQLHRMATDLKEQQESTRLLEQAGVKFFVAQMLDPVENAAMAAAALGASAIATPAAGAGIVAARFGKALHATAVTGAGIGAMGAGSLAGADYTLADYIATAAIGGTLSYVTAPKGPRALTQPKVRQVEQPSAAPEVKEAAAGARATDASKKQEEVVEPTVAKETAPVKETEAPKKEPEAAPTKAEPPKVTREEVIDAFRNDTIPKAGQRLTRGEEKVLTRQVADLKYKLKTAMESAPTRVKGFLDDFARKGVPVRAAKAQAEAAAKAETDAAIKAVRDQLDVAESKLNASLEAKKAQGQLDTLDSHGKLPPEWEAKVNEAIPQTPSEILLQQAVDAADSVVPVAKVTKPKEAPKTEAPKAEPTPVGTPEAPVDVPVRTETASSTEQQVDAVLKQQGGMQDVSQGMLKKGFRFFRELVSEYDKLTGGIPALQQFLSKVLDDPLRRAGLFGENASSYLRANLLKANTEMQLWESTLDNYVRSITGVGKLKSLFDFSQNHINTRLEIEDSIGRELLKRNEAARRGEAIVPHSDPELQKLIELFEETTHKSAQRAKEQGLAGMEDYERIAGYFHRSWDYEKMVRFNNANPVYHQSGPLKGQLIKNGALIEMIKASALKGMPDLADAEATAIARAIVDRTFDKASGAQTDFMGQLGKLETDNIVEMMRASDVDEVMIESIKRRLDTVASEKSGVKYVKNRIPLDMTMKWTPADGGTPVSMADLINTDVSRLLENYQQAMAGRGALAKVGIGGDEQSIQSWMQQYFDVLNKQDLSKSQKDAMLEQMQHLIGDFTGVRPESAVLSPTMSILKAMATATMLGSTGVLQIGESSVIMARHGAMTSMRHILQKAPVIGKLMQEIGNNPKLYEEWEAVTGMSFSSDTRIRSWKRQHEVGLVQDSGMQRLAYAQQQLVPTLTGQRLVHKMQSEALLNQNLYTLWKASKGDKDALELIKQYGNLTGTHLERIRDAAVVSKKGTLKEMRLGTLSQSELDSVTDLITRMQDHLLLTSRPGYGTSYGRTAVGQLLGQFTSYVGMAHNLTLRATAEHEGALGVAKVLAYQYPMMLMVTYMNETRKGNLLDLTDDNDLKELASKALSMSSVLGLYGDVASTVLGSNSRGLAATGIMDTPGNFTNSIRSLATGDFEKAGADLVKTARSSTIFGVVPGSQFLETTLKGDL